MEISMLGPSRDERSAFYLAAFHFGRPCAELDLEPR